MQPIQNRHTSVAQQPGAPSFRGMPLEPPDGQEPARTDPKWKLLGGLLRQKLVGVDKAKYLKFKCGPTK